MQRSTSFRQLVAAVLLSTSFAISPCVAQQAPASGDDGTLLYAVYVMRHGVRSPTAEPSQYNRFSSAPWPSWSVAPGNLTPHGFELIKLFGAYDREKFAHDGLFAGNGCDDTSRVTIHADSDERTRETARAMAEGLFPGCKVPTTAKQEGENDPLFHMPDGGVTAEESAIGARAVLDRLGGNAGNAALAYHAPLARLDQLLATCGTNTPRPDRTSLFALPATVVAGHGDHVVEVKGPLSTASTLSEIMLLEYAEGMPSKDVAWGCVDGAAVREQIELHTASSDITLRAPAVAVPQSRALLQVIGKSLQQAERGQAVAGAEGKPTDKLLLLVGHDTNLTNIAGALRLNWLIDGRRNDTPPGSTMIFALWRKKNGEEVVRVSFTAQTLEQMRNASALDEKQPPPLVPVFVPGCSGSDGSCSAADIVQLLTRR